MPEAYLRVVNGTQDLVGDLDSAAVDLDISGLDGAFRSSPGRVPSDVATIGSRSQTAST